MFDYMRPAATDQQREGFTLMPLLGVPDTALDVARSVDVSTLSSDDVRRAMAELRVWQGLGATLEARLRDRAASLTAAADASVSASEPNPSGEAPALPLCDDPGVSAETLDADSGLSPAEGRRRQRRAECLAEFTAVAALLADGLCSTDHVDVIAGAWSAADGSVAARLVHHDRDLADAARCRPPALLRRYVQRLITAIAAELGVERARNIREQRSVRHWYATSEGLGRISGQCDAGDYQRFSAALDAAARQLMRDDSSLTREQATADALVGLVCGDISGGRSSPTGVGVLIDMGTLVDGLHDASVCEFVNGAAVDVATVRSLATQHGVVPIVIDGAGMPLDVGRSRRLATTAQRSALAAVHATCMVPDCDATFDRCDIHHLQSWESGGSTDLANLGPLCSACHHHVHDRAWQIELDADRKVTVTRSDGTVVMGRPDRQPCTIGAP